MGSNQAVECVTPQASRLHRKRDKSRRDSGERRDGTYAVLIHAEINAIQYLQSKGFSQIIAVGASRNFCNDCVNQLLSLGLPK